MISLESQVLERHLSFFDGKSVLFTGGISDNFPQTLASKCPSIQIWSCYFDYARTQSAVNFQRLFQLTALYDDPHIICLSNRFRFA